MDHLLRIYITPVEMILKITHKLVLIKLRLIRHKATNIGHPVRNKLTNEGIALIVIHANYNSVVVFSNIFHIFFCFIQLFD